MKVVTTNSVESTSKTIYDEFCMWMLLFDVPFVSFFRGKSANVTHNFLGYLQKCPAQIKNIDVLKAWKDDINIDFDLEYGSTYKISLQRRKLDGDDIYYFYVNDIIIKRDATYCKKLYDYMIKKI